MEFLVKIGYVTSLMNIALAASRISSISQRYITKQGESIQLNCTVEASEWSQFYNVLRWSKVYKHESYVMNSFGAVLAPPFDGQNFDLKAEKVDSFIYSHLTIKDITLGENGTYSCQLLAENKVLDEIEYNVIVPAPIDSIDFKSSDVREDDDLGIVFSFIEDQPSYIECHSIGGNPQPHLRVHLGDRDITSEFEYVNAGKFKGDEGSEVAEHEQKLVASDFKISEKDRNKELKCTAKAGRFPQYKRVVTVTTEVQFSPKITCPNEVETYVGSTFYAIKCVARANPGVNSGSIRWATDNIILDLADPGVLNTASAGTQVDYFTANKDTVESKSGTKPPKSRVTLKDISHQQETAQDEEGRQGNVLTDELSTPLPWSYAANHTIDPNTGELHMMLVFSNVTYASFQTYTLSVSNDVGTSHRDVILRESKPKHEANSQTSTSSASKVIPISPKYTYDGQFSVHSSVSKYSTSGVAALLSYLAVYLSLHSILDS